MNVAGIYQIRNILDNKVYIGSTYNFRHRFKNHKNPLKNNEHPNIHLQKAWNLYGENSFVFEILIVCHPDLLLFYEQQFLDQWKPEYNINKDASSCRGNKASEETKKKMSAASKGRSKTESHKDAIAFGHILNNITNSIAGYKGVSFYKPHGKYRSRITINRVTKNLGYFYTPEEAHEAYLNARSEWLRKGG